MSEKLNPIDITPEDNGLSPEEREAHRAEVRPRGEETLEDARKAMEKEIAETEAMQAKRREFIRQSLENTAEQKISPIALVEKFKHSKSFRARVTGVAAIALGVIGITAGAFTISHLNKDAGNVPPAPTPTATTEQAMIPVEGIEEDTGDTVDNPEHELSGIIDGYGEEGMWESDGKTGPYAFADFKKVVEMHDGDVKEAIKDVTRKQVESLADFVSGLNDNFRPAGYENLSMAEINEKIEGLSDIEYDNLKEYVDGLIDNADVKEVTLNGKYDNAYMGVKSGDQIMGSKEAVEKNVEINHETMQLIKCTTDEKGSKAYEITLHEGEETYSLLVKEACDQIVEKEGSNPGRFVGLPEAAEKAITGGGSLTFTITSDGPIIVTPTPGPGPDPKPTPQPKKWGKSGDPHAGTNYGQTIVTNPAVPDISNINAGNQGYVDDMGATPGSSSESIGITDSGFADSGIVAPGADAGGERLEGGQDQSDGQMAGENAYQDQSAIEQGQQADSGGDQAQESAQESSSVGGDNNSDSQEESRVAEGNF